MIVVCAPPICGWCTTRRHPFDGMRATTAEEEFPAPSDLFFSTFERVGVACVTRISTIRLSQVARVIRNVCIAALNITKSFILLPLSIKAVAERLLIQLRWSSFSQAFYVLKNKSGPDW